MVSSSLVMSAPYPQGYHENKYYYARPLPQPGVHVERNPKTTWPDDLYSTNNYFRPNYYHLNNYLGFVGYPARVHRNVYGDSRHWPESPESTRRCLNSGC